MLSLAFSIDLTSTGRPAVLCEFEVFKVRGPFASDRNCESRFFTTVWSGGTATAVDMAVDAFTIPKCVATVPHRGYKCLKRSAKTMLGPFENQGGVDSTKREVVRHEIFDVSVASSTDHVV